jgi:RNA polymerase sigma factor for flagellar operon FliA
MIHDHSKFSAARAYGGEVGSRVQRFLPMVRKLAWHLSGSTGPSLDVDDLMQAGLVALTECAQRHAGPGEDGFAAYAKIRVRGAMVDLLRSASADPRGLRQRRRQLETAEAALRNQLGRDATPAELAQIMGRSVEEVQQLRSDLVPVHISSIDESYSDSDLAFAHNGPDAEHVLLQVEDRDVLIQAIGELPQRLQLVIQLYFVEELNLKEIAMALDVSVPRVHQLKAAALEKLRIFHERQTGD